MATRGRKAPPDPEKAALDSISAGQLIEALTAISADRANQRAIERETDRRARVQWLGSVLGVLGVGGIASALGIAYTLVNGNIDTRLDAIENDLRGIIAETTESEDFANRLNARIEDLSSERFSVLENQMKQMVTYQQFLVLASRMHVKGRYSSDDGDLAIRLMKRMFETNTIVSDDALLADVERVLDTFLFNSDTAGMLRADDILRDRITEHRGIVWTMIHHYGVQLLVSVNVDVAESDEWQRFAFYEEVGRRHNHIGQSLPYRILGEFELAGRVPNVRVERLLASVRTLSDEARTSVLDQFYSLLPSETAEDTSDSTTRLLGEVVQRFVETYAESISSTFGENSCRYANDGVCDVPDYCMPGTDAADCS